MKFILPKKVLTIAVNRLQGVLSDRGMAQIGLRCMNDQIYFSALDRVIAVYCNFECEVQEEGTLFVPGKLFSDLSKELPEGNIIFSTAETFLNVQGGHEGEFLMRIPLIENSQWKEPPNFDDHQLNSAKIPANKIAYMIEQVQPCIQLESARNYGAVGYIHRISEDKLRLVGTDGYRLSYCDIELEMPESFLPQGVCLSKRSLLEMQKISTEGFDEVFISVSPDLSTLVISTSNYKIFTGLASVKYPKYQGVLPSANLDIVTLSRPKLQIATRRVMLASDKTNSMQMCFGDRLLTLFSKTLGSSEGKETLALADYRGAGADLSVNGKFLSDVFAVLPSDEITFQFKSESDPIVIIPKEEPKNCKSMHVLVPIRESVT